MPLNDKIIVWNLECVNIRLFSFVIFPVRFSLLFGTKTTWRVVKEWGGRWGRRSPPPERSSACLGLPSGTSRQARTFSPPRPGRRPALGGSRSCLGWDQWWSPPAWSCRSRCRRWCRWPGRCPCPSPRLGSCSRPGAPPARWGPRTSRSPWWWRGWCRRPAPRWEASGVSAWKLSRKTFHSQGRDLEISKHQDGNIFIILSQPAEL